MSVLASSCHLLRSCCGSVGFGQHLGCLLSQHNSSLLGNLCPHGCLCCLLAQHSCLGLGSHEGSHLGLKLHLLQHLCLHLQSTEGPQSCCERLRLSLTMHSAGCQTRQSVSNHNMRGRAVTLYALRKHLPLHGISVAVWHGDCHVHTAEIAAATQAAVWKLAAHEELMLLACTHT